MSHVADALRRANRDAMGAAEFRDGDHPWGQDLAAAASGSDPVWPVDGTRAYGSAFVDVKAATRRPLRVPASLPDRVCREATSPLADLDAGARQQIAGLAERVFLSGSEEARRMVAFAGLDTDSPTAWISAAVADMLAHRTDARIGVVDMDFASPSLHECFGISLTPGLLQALGSDAPIAESARRVHDNLWTFPAGAPGGGPELTVESRAQILRLTTAFDHVIVNLGSLATWSGGGLPTMADGVVLVIAAEATRREPGRKVAERLHASGASMLGAVLTNRRFAIPEAIYKRL